MNIYSIIVFIFYNSSAQSIDISSDKTLPMVEIKVFCISAFVKDQLMAKIRTGIKSIPLFHSNYLEELGTGDKIHFVVVVVSYICVIGLL